MANVLYFSPAYHLNFSLIKRNWYPCIAAQLSDLNRRGLLALRLSSSCYRCLWKLCCRAPRQKTKTSFRSDTSLYPGDVEKWTPARSSRAGQNRPIQVFQGYPWDGELSGAEVPFMTVLSSTLGFSITPPLQDITLWHAADDSTCWPCLCLEAKKCWAQLVPEWEKDSGKHSERRQCQTTSILLSRKL